MQVQLRTGLRSPLPSLAESRDLRDHLLLLLPGTGENVRHPHSDSLSAQPDMATACKHSVSNEPDPH